MAANLCKMMVRSPQRTPSDPKYRQCQAWATDNKIDCGRHRNGCSYQAGQFVCRLPDAHDGFHDLIDPFSGALVDVMKIGNSGTAGDAPGRAVTRVSLDYVTQQAMVAMVGQAMTTKMGVRKTPDQGTFELVLGSQTFRVSITEREDLPVFCRHQVIGLHGICMTCGEVSSAEQ